MSDLKARVRAGELTVGSWLSLGHAGVAEVVANAGFDWVVVDLEHSTTSLAQAEAMLRAIEGCGVAPLVRLSTSEPEQARVQIKRTMDAGAHGIIVPMVSSAAVLSSAARAMHYPPRGDRGVGLARAQRYGAGFEAYREWLGRSALLVAQIEHRDALSELASIFAVPDLDAYLVGPYDLSASFGRPGDFEHPDVVDALARIAAAADAAGIPAGIHVVDPDPAALRRRIDQGYRFVAYGVDFRMLDVVSRAGIRVARGAHGTGTGT